MSRPAEIPFGFREFDPSRDLPSLERLAQVCFSSFWRPGVLHWKFTRNPSGPPAAVMAFHEGNLVGFYAAVPALFRVGTDRRVVYQAVDAMVHPDFQRRGLFAQLARKTYDLIAQREPSVLVFGVTNYHILPGHIDKLQSHLLRRIPYIFTHRWLQGGSSPGDLLVEEVKNIPPDMAEYFARREPSDSAIELLWSPETLHWRIFQDPRGSNSLLLARRAGEILGYCVINTEEAARS